MKSQIKSITLLLVFSVSLSFSQSQYSTKIDSLRSIINTATPDTTTVKALNELSKNLLWASSYDSAFIYLQQSKTLSRQLKYKRGEAVCMKSIGNYNFYQANYSAAIESYSLGAILFHQLKDEQGAIDCNSNMSLAYFNKGDYINSISKSFMVLKMQQKINDSDGVARSYNNIGNIYYVQDNFKDGLKYHFFALKIRLALNSKRDIAESYNNIGLIYHRQKKYDQAVYMYLKSMQICKEINDWVNIANAYANIGSVYEEQNKLDLSLENQKISLRICDSLGIKLGMGISYLHIGSIYKIKKDYDQSINYYQKGLDVLKSIGNLENTKFAYLNLSDVYKLKNQSDKALQNYELYIIYRDSITNNENVKNQTRLEMSYEFEKKQAITKLEQEKKDAEVIAESKKQRIVIWCTCAGLILITGFLLFLYKGFRKIKSQKKIIEEQKKLVDEKQKETLDSIRYAQTLQEAILPSTFEMNENLKDCTVFYNPKDIVAGDFYFYQKLNGYDFVAAADCTGHGVPGAMISVVCSTALNRAVNEFGLTDPAEILNMTNELVKKTFRNNQKDGMDISLMVINKETRSIKWSGANNPLWYINENIFSEIKGDKQPIGNFSETKPFTTHTIDYKEGTSFYLITDGYADQFGGPNNKKFKYQPLKDLLLKFDKNGPMFKSTRIFETFNSWKGENEQTDDVTIINFSI